MGSGGSDQEHKNLLGWNRPLLTALQMTWGLEAGNNLGKTPACSSEQPRCRAVLLLTGMEHYFN